MNISNLRNHSQMHQRNTVFSGWCTSNKLHNACNLHKHLLIFHRVKVGEKWTVISALLFTKFYRSRSGVISPAVR